MAEAIHDPLQGWYDNLGAQMAALRAKFGTADDSNTLVTPQGKVRAAKAPGNPARPTGYDPTQDSYHVPYEPGPEWPGSPEWGGTTPFTPSAGWDKPNPYGGDPTLALTPYAGDPSLSLPTYGGDPKLSLTPYQGDPNLVLPDYEGTPVWDGGTQWQGFTEDDLELDPGYHFRLREGLKAIRRDAAAAGLSGGGATLKALQRFGQEMGSQEFAAARGRAVQDYGITRAEEIQAHNYAIDASRYDDQRDYQQHLDEFMAARDAARYGHESRRQREILQHAAERDARRYLHEALSAQQLEEFKAARDGRRYLQETLNAQELSHYEALRDSNRYTYESARMDDDTRFNRELAQYQIQTEADRYDYNMRRGTALEDNQIAYDRALTDYINQVAAQDRRWNRNSFLTNLAMRAAGGAGAAGSAATTAGTNLLQQAAAAHGQGQIGAANARLQSEQFWANNFQNMMNNIMQGAGLYYGLRE